MPLTLPTHPVAVVPLKLWRPRWFDGVALTIGAIAPDLAFAADGYGVTIHSHAWHAVSADAGDPLPGRSPRR
ncbi:DUF4184 family protein [Catellatospora methionotrophica]|uniref:DUF4184 family protein n=1 Tax=Catellatospora methionotrophica TaxID=121620 RepID=UPI00340E4703